MDNLIGKRVVVIATKGWASLHHGRSGVVVRDTLVPGNCGVHSGMQCIYMQFDWAVADNVVGYFLFDEFEFEVKNTPLPLPG